MRTHLTITSCMLLALGTPLSAQVATTACTVERGPLAASDAAVTGTVIGRVVDVETRLPLQSANVRIEWEDGAERRNLELHTDTDGRFSACPLPAARPIRVTALFGRATLRAHVTLEAEEVRNVEFVLDAARSQAAGRVVEQGGTKGVGDATVEIDGSRVQAVSRSDGTFSLPPVPAGDYVLTTQHVGFGERRDTVRVEWGSSVHFTIGLAQAAVPLEPLNVEVRSPLLERRGFYERQQRSHGAFLTRQTWQDRHPRTASDLVRSVGGIRITPRRTGMGNVLLDRGNCAFRYVVDGTRAMESFQLDDLPVNTIEALEVYRGAAGIPGQFTAAPGVANANCGVIVVWTRQAR